MKKVLLLLMIGVILVCSGCGLSKYSAEKFNKIQPGMSYSQVSTIMGDGGELMASTSMPAVPGIMGAIKNDIYVWKNSDGSNMNVQFQNEKVIGKAQFGLK